MTEYKNIGELEEAQDRESSAARERIEQAEEHIHYYRTQMIRLQETFYDIARAAGVENAPGFQAELRRVTDQIDENVAAATKVVIGFDDELTEMAARHRKEHEDFHKRRNED